jgi:hypothetical protein
MALISQSEVEARLKRALTAEETSAFTLQNATMQDYLEKIIGSDVEAVSETTRYFDGGVQHLAINPCTNITALKYVDDDTAVEYTFLTSDYTAEPVNNTLKTMVRNRDGKFATGINNVAVTAKFSIYADEQIRNIVKNALIEALVVELNGNNKKRESIEGYSVEYITDQAKDTLNGIKYLFPGI